MFTGYKGSFQSITKMSYKQLSGAQKRKNKIKTELTAATSDPKQWKLLFSFFEKQPPEHVDIEDKLKFAQNELFELEENSRKEPVVVKKCTEFEANNAGNDGSV